MENCILHPQHTGLTRLIALLKSDPCPGIPDVMEHWARVPYEAFSDKESRSLIHEIQDLLESRLPSIARFIGYTDQYLTDQRLGQILRDISRGDSHPFDCFLSDLFYLQDHDFSDTFCSKTISLLMFLIQFRLDKQAIDLLKTAPWVGRFEDAVYKDRNCAYTYAIEMIPDEQDLLPYLDAIDCSMCGDLFMDRITPAMAAVKTGKHLVLQQLFEKNMCSEEFALGDLTVMQYGVITNDLPLLHLALFTLHHSADSTGATKQTPLMLAVERDNLKLAAFLLQQGADPNAADNNGHSVLSYCQSPAMEMLLTQNKAVACNKAAEILSQAIQAAQNGPVPQKLLEEVLRHCPDTITYQGTNLAVLAARNGYADNLQWLTSRYPLHDQAEALACAIFQNGLLNKPVSLLIRLVEILEKAGLTVQTDQMSLMHPFPTLAVHPELFDQVRPEDVFTLLNKIEGLGFDPFALIFQEESLLSYAVQSANKPMICYCLSLGFSLTDLDATTGIAALLLSNLPLAQRTDSRIRQVWAFCHAMGCRINRQDGRGETALHAIVRQSWATPERIQLALELGCDPSIPNCNGKTARQLAYDLGRQQELLSALPPQERSYL